MLGQAEVVVAVEGDHPAPVHLRAHALPAFDRAAHAHRVPGLAPGARLGDPLPQIRTRRAHGYAAQAGAGPASTMSACTVPPVSTTGIGFRPSRANSAWSRSTSGLPVVSSFSP